MSERALSGLKVLEVGHYYAGAYCARVLAGFGAEVVKVEPPGDPARLADYFPGSALHAGKSALYLFLNTGKKSVTLDLKSEEGRRLARRLVGQADVLVDGFAPRLLPALGLDYRTLERENPALVQTSLSTFGQTGPYRDFKGSSLVAAALGGTLYQGGEPGQEPLREPGWQPEFVAGWYGVIGTMSALRVRRTTGRGQHVDVSAVESVATCHNYNTVLFSYQNEVKTRTGKRADRSHPLTIYLASDGYVAIGASSADQWEALCCLIDAPQFLGNEAYLSGRGRLQAADEIDACLMPWVAARRKREIFLECQQWRIPAAPVYDLDEVLQDEHFRERDFWVSQAHPTVLPRRTVYPGSAFRLSETPWQIGRAPLPGEHNREVYGQWLGLEDEVTS